MGAIQHKIHTVRQTSSYEDQTDIIKTTEQAMQLVNSIGSLLSTPQDLQSALGMS